MSGDTEAPEPSVRDIDMVRVRYADSAGHQHLVRLEEAADVPFEDGRMVRAIPSHRDQGHMPGQYWVAKWGDFAEYESVLESRWLTLLDFDPQVTAFVTQPLEFVAIDARGAWQHTPDVFVRHRDGSVLLLDVKNPELRDDPDVLLQEERTRRTCERLDWDYAMVSEPSEQRWVNVDLLSSARRPLHLGADLVPRLLELAREPVEIGELIRFMEYPDLARAVLYHLMWHQRIVTDLDRPLRDTTLVKTAAEAQHDV
ncbi:TnsA-like heteromeric transposase endonuclease subunit [Streptomyces acidiscabies]|uniref:TnsA-like heteromeric transposase endonuclease subunit n=1 Tax=Streptomyces acidiscabies TaxID=42234 RepID=A0AAP6EGP1_9ACTN|nr:TnsA-like heteromeric transposase endonuclease subunit [Streptomyces acidiscabies]MDX2962029.1 TnsA-like heteromeric transposase endonuclease subunit [Streptomyces acidiscabies]MDX3017974.1 TnsA-like heteromeric transposase endonuclease subunit [Streptomyces acidiscabies]MDX3791253.1 TnsA-like heteromeric transposase endonuclease subunit [Streptomyces acidiscabies]